MAKWRTSEKPSRMATIVGCIASDSGFDREVFCLSRLFLGRDHFLAQFCDICAFFHSKSHENCLKERKNRTDKFSSSITFFLLKAHADHFETFGLFLGWFSLFSGAKLLPYKVCYPGNLFTQNDDVVHCNL